MSGIKQLEHLKTIFTPYIKPVPERFTLPLQHVLESLPSQPMQDRSSDEETGFTPKVKDLESYEAAWDLYSRWCQYHKIHRTPEEMQLKFDNFIQNAVHVFKLNQMDPTWHFHLDFSCDGKNLFDHKWFHDELFLIPTERELESDEAVLDLYYRWCVRHLIRRTPNEMQRRLNIFKKNAFHILKINQKDPSCKICLSIWCDRIDLHDGDEEMIVVTPTAKDLESDQALRALYARWRTHHEISRTPKEIHHMFNAFKDSAIHVFEMNQTDPTCQFCLSFGCDETVEFVYETRMIPTERDLNSGNAVLNLYQRYSDYYSIPVDMLKLNNFKKSVTRVYEMNQMESSCKFYMSPHCDKDDMLEQAAWEVRIRPTWRDLESDEAVWALYHRWCACYNIRRTPEEMKEKFETLKRSAQMCYEKNLEEPGSLALSKFCDEPIPLSCGVKS